MSLSGAEEVNEALRAHVLRVGFDLSLGKTHVAALVMLDEMLRRNEHVAGHRAVDMQIRRQFNLFVPGINGCIERGLVTHRPPLSNRPGACQPRRVWTITRAGRIVIDLLKEAGVYQEYHAALPVAEEAS